jgi:proteic killer suppression protein
MIRSFGDRRTEDLFHGRETSRSRRVPVDVVERVIVKLDMLHWAVALQDLAAPPGNRLEALRGELSGWSSIRLNEQWRLVFRWIEGDAPDVSFVDDHP